MESGVVKEFDSVPGLMGRTDSTFRAMVAQAGLEGAASASVSRVASVAALAAATAAGKGSDEEEAQAPPTQPPGGSGERPVQGLPTFVRQLKDDYDLK